MITTNQKLADRETFILANPVGFEYFKIIANLTGYQPDEIKRISGYLAFPRDMIVEFVRRYYPVTKIIEDGAFYLISKNLGEMEIDFMISYDGSVLITFRDIASENNETIAYSIFSILIEDKQIAEEIMGILKQKIIKI